MELEKLAISLRERFSEKCRNEESWRSFWQRDVWYAQWNKTQEQCGLSTRLMQHKQTGAFVGFSMRCRQWLCEYCGPHQAVMLLSDMMEVAKREGGMWFAAVNPGGSRECVQAMRQRVRKRASVAKADYCIACRFVSVGPTGLDRALVFASADLGGRLPPVKMTRFDIVATWRLLALAFRVPGLRPYGVTRSKRWSEGKRMPSTYRFILDASTTAIERALRELGLKEGEQLDPGLDHTQVAARVAELVRSYQGDGGPSRFLPSGRDT